MSRERFIRLGAAVGLGSAAAPLVSACRGGGGSAGSGETPTASGTAGGGGPEVRKGQAIAKQSEVAANTAFPFTDGETGQQGVLVNLEDGEFAASGEMGALIGERAGGGDELRRQVLGMEALACP